MPLQSTRPLAALCAALVLVSGCGEQEPPDTAGAAAETTATTAPRAVAPALDEDALAAVRDKLAACLRKADVGVVVRLRDGEAAVDGPGGQRKLESSLAAPEETAKAIEEGALYVGLRDDERTKGLTPDWDVLIFGSEDAATRATTPLRTEAGDPVAATQSGRFVTVVLPQAEANGDDPEGVDAKLAACQRMSEAG